MQQTEKYQFNLIEPSDTFSPAPLNENIEKVEAALGTKADAADHTTLSQRVSALEAHYYITGVYTGNGMRGGDFQIIQLGVTPTALVTLVGVCIPETPVDYLEIIPGGFKAYTRNLVGSSTVTGMNTKGTTYTYLAII